jgi:hypothetical protein
MFVDKLKKGFTIGKKPREAADFKISRRKSTEQKIGNLLEVRAPETIFGGKCGLRA